MGIGTSDFGAAQTDASTQGGPPLLELSSFLQDLSLGATSSPVTRAPVSVFSPSFQRFLDRESAARSPPPPRVTVEAAVSAFVTHVDVAVDACVGTADQEVQATAGFSDAFTDYDPPAEIAPVAELLETVLCESPSANVRRLSFSFESSVEPPEDFTVDGSLADEPSSELAAPALDPASEETSPIGPSLVDSDDELIATRLPGYLSNFETCEVSDQYLHSFIFLFSFLLAIQIFRLFHLFSIVLVLFAVQFCMLCFFHIFLIVKSFQTWRFSLLSCILAILATFHLFYILKIFLFRFGYFSSFSFQFTSLFHPNFGFGLKDLNFGSEVVLYISFSLLHFFNSFSLIFPDEKHYFTSFFHHSG